MTTVLDKVESHLVWKEVPFVLVRSPNGMCLDQDTEICVNFTHSYPCFFFRPTLGTLSRLCNKLYVSAWYLFSVENGQHSQCGTKFYRRVVQCLWSIGLVRSQSQHHDRWVVFHGGRSLYTSRVDGPRRRLWYCSQVRCYLGQWILRSPLSRAEFLPGNILSMPSFVVARLLL